MKLTDEQAATILHEVFMYLTEGNYDFTVQVGDVVIKCTEEGEPEEQGEGGNDAD